MRAQVSFPSCLALAVMLLGGCSDSPTGPDLVLNESILVVSPATGRIAAGGTLQLTVSVSGSNQSVTLSPELVWSSSDEQVAGVSAKGVVFGRAGGTTDIIARWNGLRGASRITVVAASTPELKPPETCIALPIYGAKRGANVTTAIPVCKER
jgi:large exoprotein involved in heme utilization and adhesion